MKIFYKVLKLISLLTVGAFGLAVLGTAVYSLLMK